MLKKIFSFFLFIIAINTAALGFVLSITNYQANIRPDGYPLDSWWVIAALFATAIITGVSAGLLSKK